HQHQLAANVPERAIHASLIVPEDTIGQQLLQQSIRPCFVVILFDAHKHQQSTADTGIFLAIDTQCRVAHPLQQSNHDACSGRNILAISVVARTSASVFPGSLAEWPASRMMNSSASGQCRCSAKALSNGHTTS